MLEQTEKNGQFWNLKAALILALSVIVLMSILGAIALRIEMQKRSRVLPPEEVLQAAITDLKSQDLGSARIRFEENKRLNEFFRQADAERLKRFADDLERARLIESTPEQQVYETIAFDHEDGVEKSIRFRLVRGLDGRWRILMPGEKN